MSEVESVEEHAARVARDGYTVVEGAFQPAFADAMAADLERLERELGIQPAENLFEGLKTKRVYNLLARGRLYERVVDDDLLLGIVERVLGRGFLVSTVSSVAIEPGETAQPIHADDQLIPLDRPHPPLTCTIMVALTDFTEENGATRILPGSHLRSAAPELGQPYESIPAEMKKGGALLYNGSLWHGGGANRSPARRVGLAVGFCVGWMRQQENQQLGIPRDVAKAFSPRLRKLVGYGIYKGLYGHIDKCSPVDLLDESGPRVVVGVMRK